MQQLEFDLRPSLTVQYELPLDYTGCDVNKQWVLSNTSDMILTVNGNLMSWGSLNSGGSIQADTVVVNKPVKTLWLNLKQWMK